MQLNDKIFCPLIIAYKMFICSSTKPDCFVLIIVCALVTVLVQITEVRIFHGFSQ